MMPTSPLLKVVHTLIIAGLVTALVVGITRSFGGVPLTISQVSTNKQSTFDVTGEAKTVTIPDQAQVNVGITATDSSVKAVQDKANGIINDINTQLTKLGIDKKDIKTSSYYLSPNYNYEPSQGQKITGYTATASLEVTLTDFDKLNQAIDAATAAGANQVGGISFTLSDKKTKEIQDQARQEAIENAKQKADTLSHLAGMRLGRIVNVMEQPNQGPYPRPMYDMAISAEKASGGAPTNAQPGSTTYTYTVTLSYETL